MSADLQRRYGIIDLLCVLFIAGTLAALLPDNAPPKARAGAFIGCLAFTGCSSWWGATLAHSFGINQPLKRLLVHLYSLIAFASFLTFLVTGFAWLVMLTGVGYSDSATPVFVATLVFLVTGAVTVSIYFIERKRIMHDRAAVNSKDG